MTAPFLATPAASAALIVSSGSLWYGTPFFAGTTAFIRSRTWREMIGGANYRTEGAMPQSVPFVTRRPGGMYVVQEPPPIPMDVKFLITLKRTLGDTPPWVFGVAWTIVYGLNATATYYFFQDFGDEPTFWYTFALLLANFMVNKMWTLFFFDLMLPVVALVDILLCLASAIAVLVLFGIEAESREIVPKTPNWIPFGVWIPYVLWLVFVAYLNARFVYLWDQKPRMP